MWGGLFHWYASERYRMEMELARTGKATVVPGYRSQRVRLSALPEVLASIPRGERLVSVLPSDPTPGEMQEPDQRFVEVLFEEEHDV